MAHDGPLAAGIRHRSSPGGSVPGRRDRTDGQPSEGATADAVQAYVGQAVAVRPIGAPGRPGAGVPGRRTVTITGRGAERRVPESRHGRHDQRRPFVPRHERQGFRPDRAAGMAVALALLLVIVAAASAHAASAHAAGAHAALSRAGSADAALSDVGARTRVRADARTAGRPSVDGCKSPLQKTSCSLPEAEYRVSNGP
jgi:hypothetical protein